jgi:hypothetical protein
METDPVSETSCSLEYQMMEKVQKPSNSVLINSVWNKEKLPDQWKESIIVPVHKNGDKTDCSSYCGRPRHSSSG